MSSSSRRDDEGSSAFPAKAPSFFKIVLQSALLHGKLEIPELVVMKHGNCLANSIFLKVPSGAVWKIELTRCGTKVWLRKGWPEFANFYSINHGYLLVFSSEGDYSHFQVRIFSRNTLEIHYPFNPSHDEEPRLCGELQLPKMEVLEQPVSSKILDLPSMKSRKRTDLISHRPYKMMRTNSSAEAKGNSKTSGVTERQGLKHDRENKQHGGGRGMSTAKISSQTSRKVARGSSASLRTSAFIQASSFKSDNPFLVVAMYSTYISNSLRLSVSFVKQHICAEGVRNMNLQNSDGRIWPVKCVVVEYEKRPYATLYDGWRPFVRENHLKFGDACVFELIHKGREITFKVGIYRTEDAP